MFTCPGRDHAPSAGAYLSAKLLPPIAAVPHGAPTDPHAPLHLQHLREPPGREIPASFPSISRTRNRDGGGRRIPLGMWSENIVAGGRLGSRKQFTSSILRDSTVPVRWDLCQELPLDEMDAPRK